MPDVPTQIQQLLEQNLTIHTIEIRDDSHHHAGHAEAAAHGGGHYTLTLSSPDFANLTRLQPTPSTRCAYASARQLIKIRARNHLAKQAFFLKVSST